MDAPLPSLSAVYGDPPAALAALPPGARQMSPLVPGSDALETVAPETLGTIVMRAPPGTIERRAILAAMLRALAPGAPFTVLAAKTMGGARLGRELAGLGASVEDSARAHHRICRGRRPERLDAAAIEAAITDGAPRRVGALGLWSQPGIFSWDRLDPGTALLAEALPPLAGRGADLGCGLGILAHAVLSSPAVSQLALIDIDRRAIEAARRNVDDPRVKLSWADVEAGTGLAALDFVVTNPPFHEAGSEAKALGQAFIRRAAEALRSGGTLWLVANRHLPYEQVLESLFRRVTPRIAAHGFKVLEAVK